ncbi:MAG: YnbE family lipoprotein [Deltaproteobacteria bacterium]|nr:YnbE family lipoprotein [Deltaproteobacteria bacterium]
MSRTGSLASAALAAGIAAAAAGCQPRVAVEAPKEPIVIQMNIKIEHEIKVQVDRELDDLIASEKDIF